MVMAEELHGVPDGVYLSTSEAARVLRVSSKTVSRWAKDGKLPHVTTLGVHRRFPEDAVNDLARTLRIL